MSCRHVLGVDGNQEPVALVSHRQMQLPPLYGRVTWEFLCAECVASIEAISAVLVCMDCIRASARDGLPDLAEIFDLPDGFQAVRVHQGSEWLRTPIGAPN